jgi:hypothetical protein
MRTLDFQNRKNLRILIEKRLLIMRLPSITLTGAKKTGDHLGYRKKERAMERKQFALSILTAFVSYPTRATVESN